MNSNCLYKRPAPESKTPKVKNLLREESRGKLLGFSDWPDSNLMGIIATEKGDIILIDYTDIRIVQ